ncbi:IS66 family transposase [Serratia symbiotica]|uniref:IS66 family transposase n=3 Tax=Serratia symbiotica TaxID=138074 RepID=A0A7D5STA3_9GAMM|nr:IS66 family transposase [Serratia symbiotica]
MIANRGAVVSMPAMCLRAGALPWWWTVMLVTRRCSASGQAVDTGCWAHARRTFFELFTANPSPVAKLALDTIHELYRLERKIKHRSADKKRQWRQRYATPRLDAFHQWLLLQQAQTAPNSRLRKALDYPLKRWSALLRYLDDSHVPIDNNRMENCLRPVAVGRKNGLFAESLRAGQRMAAILNLLETAKLNGHDPSIWLRDVLPAYPPGPTIASNNYYPTPKTASVNIRQLITLF